MSGPVIADAGPLIGLARAELLHLLRQLYEVVATEEGEAKPVDTPADAM